MDTALLQDFAQQVVKDGILLNWKFYVILILIQSASTLLMEVAKRYFGKRSEIAATKADFQEILRQLRTSTETTEEIKTTLAHKDWSVKEYKTLRRTKLEELMTAVYEISRSTGNLTYTAMNNESLEDNGALHNKIRLLGKLYFPELTPTTDQLFFAHNEMLGWAIDTNRRFLEVNRNSNEYADLYNQSLQGARSHSLTVAGTANAVEKQAAILMQEIIGYQ